MNVELAHNELMKKHAKKRRGERLRRLKDGHDHAEKMFLEQVWWPAFGHFEYLHPEYEISDFRDGMRFIDFAYLQGSLRLAIEIDGYGPHLHKISRTQFSDQWIRQNHLVISGWRILRFSYDDVRERPRMCEQIIQQFLGRWLGGNGAFLSDLSFEEKEILRFAIRGNQNLTSNDVCECLGVEHQKARKLLQDLLSKGLIIPAGKGRERVRSFQLSNLVTVDSVGM